MATSMIAIWYFLQRRRVGALMSSAAMFDDLMARRAQALEIQDRVVQRLDTARFALETGHTELADEALEKGLQETRSIITGLLGDPHASSASATAGGLRVGGDTAEG